MPNPYINCSFQTIQFSISTQFSSIWFIDRTLSGATTPGQSGPGSDGNEGILRIPKSSSITRALLSDCLVSYQGHSLGVSYFSALKQSVYSAARADWVRPTWIWWLILKRICHQREKCSQNYSPNAYWCREYVSKCRVMKE